MVKVGLIGEDPTDTLSIKHLLEKRYKNKIQFFALAKTIKGYHLDTEKLQNVLRAELASKKFKAIIFIRDLDALKSQKDKFQIRINWFNKLNIVANKIGVFLLNIWELEALIFGDIGTFNKIYHIDYKPKQAPMFIKQPKELLKKITVKSNKNFKESDCPDLFKKLDIDKVEENCGCFKDFIKDFEIQLSD